MIAVALLAIPGYVLDTSKDPRLLPLAMAVDLVIFIAFLLETAWMASRSARPLRYVAGNWLNLVILGASAASLMGAATLWIPLVRVMRVALVGLVLARTVARSQVLFTRRGAPLLVGISVLAFLAMGGMFYWLDPAIHSFGDGVWLAFTTGTTVGYGDMLPTTAATRMLAVVTTLVGVSLIALFTANIVSFFVDNDERELRREVRLDLKHLRDKVEALRAGHAGQSVTGPTAGIAAGDRGDVRVEPVDEHARLLAEMAVLRESIEALRSALQAGLAEVRAGRQGEAER
jgi:voltage-gated potassium channel